MNAEITGEIPRIDRGRRLTRWPGSSATTPTGSVRCSTRSGDSPMSPACRVVPLRIT